MNESISNSGYQGWANIDTWKAYCLLVNYKPIYTLAIQDSSVDNLEALIFKVLEFTGADCEYLMFNQVNWSEIQSQLELLRSEQIQ